MANEENLRPNVFSKDNQPANRGRKKGVPNRATVYKKILESKTSVKLPDGSEKVLTLYEAIALGQARSAMKGNTNAWKEIQDTLHGKMKESIEHSNPDGTALAEPLAQALGQFEKALLKVYGSESTDRES